MFCRTMLGLTRSSAIILTCSAEQMEARNWKRGSSCFRFLHAQRAEGGVSLKKKKEKTEMVELT